MKKVRLEADYMIYTRDDIADSMYIIHKGSVKLFIENDQSKIIQDQFEYDFII